MNDDKLTKEAQFALNSLMFFMDTAEEVAVREGETRAETKKRHGHSDRLWAFITKHGKSNDNTK